MAFALILTACPPKMHLDAYKGDLASVQKQVESGIHVDSLDPVDATALQMATLAGHMDVAKYLIEKGADINHLDEYGWTPLNCAAFNGHAEIVELLLELGADPFIRQDEHGTALNMARKRNHTAVAAILSKPEYSVPAVRMEKMEREQRALERNKIEGNAYRIAREAHTMEAYTSFVDAHPGSGYRAQALSEVAMFARKSPELEKVYAELVDRYPDFIVHVRAEERLYYIGPPELPVRKIIELRREDVGEGIVVMKIRAQKSGYKDFDLEEIKRLKAEGLSDRIIEEMMAANMRAEKDAEARALRAEIDQLRRTIEEMQMQRTAPVASSVSSGTGISLESCAAQLAALEACEHTPGGSLGVSICKMAAKSKFPCDQ
jgi:hypothetical protein